MATAGARRSAMGTVTPIERPAAPRRRSRNDGSGVARAAMTRQALVEAAVEALREQGFGGASARDIARRAGSTQSQVFYHFGTVNDLLLAALDDVSARRMAVYAPLLEAARTPAALVATARTVVEADVAEGDLKVMVELIAGSTRVPGMAAQVAERLAPWFAFAETAVRKATAGLPFASLLPVRDIAHAIVAGILGLELLASLGGESDRTARILDQIARLAALVPTLRGRR
jgi:AcrR family transcriptional regulator